MAYGIWHMGIQHPNKENIREERIPATLYSTALSRACGSAPYSTVCACNQKSLHPLYANATMLKKSFECGIPKRQKRVQTQSTAAISPTVAIPRGFGCASTHPTRYRESRRVSHADKAKNAEKDIHCASIGGARDGFVVKHGLPVVSYCHGPIVNGSENLQDRYIPTEYRQSCPPN
jgi:hypothetical protein